MPAKKRRISVQKNKTLTPQKKENKKVTKKKNSPNESTKKNNNSNNSSVLIKKTKRDLDCPICWSILIEPVTLPCKHTLCLECYNVHVEKNPLNCPCCRFRISIWARKNKNKVDADLWRFIQDNFSSAVKLKLERKNENSQASVSKIDINSQYLDDEEIQNKNFDGEMVDETPGIIYEEYRNKILKDHFTDIQKQRTEEDEATNELIKKLQEEENELLQKERTIIDADLEFARKLQEQGTPGKPAENNNNNNKNSNNKNDNENVTQSSGDKKKLCRNLFEEWTDTSVLPSALASASSSMQLRKRKPLPSTFNSSSSSSSSLKNSNSNGRDGNGNKSLKRLSSNLKKSGFSSEESKMKNSILPFLKRQQPQPQPHSSSTSSLSPQQSSTTNNNNNKKVTPVPVQSSFAKFYSLNSSSSSNNNNPNPSPSFSFNFNFDSNDNNNQNSKDNQNQNNKSNNVHENENQRQEEVIIIEEKDSFIIPNTNTTNSTNNKNLNSPTDSINTEINTHFRPIKKAPKTPPKKFYEPTLIKPIGIRPTILFPHNNDDDDQDIEISNFGGQSSNSPGEDNFKKLIVDEEERLKQEQEENDRLLAIQIQKELQ